MIRKVLVSLIILLTIYSPIELTRVIILSWDYYGLLFDLLLEITAIWSLYLAAMILVWKLAKEASKVP